MSGPYDILSFYTGCVAAKDSVLSGPVVSLFLEEGMEANKRSFMLPSMAETSYMYLPERTAAHHESEGRCYSTGTLLVRGDSHFFALSGVSAKMEPSDVSQHLWDVTFAKTKGTSKGTVDLETSPSSIVVEEIKNSAFITGSAFGWVGCEFDINKTYEVE